MAEKAFIITRDEELEFFLDAVRSCKDNDELFDFLVDTVTPRELVEIVHRMTVARMLDKGLHYSDIEEKTGVSATTIARVSRTLKQGTGAYSTALERLK
jgi:TrpR-related protein YerC/YecD